MVFFTCNHCGESLKKPSVEKHYTFKTCRNAMPFLTCVDCLKDFRGDEFKAHTKCITEDEKYSAKGYVAKPERNKGAQKQEAWTEIIQQHLAQRTDLDSHTRQTLERIAQQTNVPRKKPKFINYIRNSLKISPNSAERIWGIIESALEEFKKKNDAVKAEQEAKRKLAEEEAKAAKLAAEDASSGEPPKKKKKNKKSEAVVTEPADDDDEEAAASTANGVPVVNGKKKKNKKDKIAAANGNGEIVENETATNGVDESSLKKKKNKKRKLSETNGNDETVVEADVSVAVGEDNQFEWKKVITEILTKKSTMNLAKLKLKVLKQLSASQNGAETTPKDEIKLMKHLTKLKKYVKVDGETVTLLSSK